MRPNLLLCLIMVQTVSKGYEQMTLAGKDYIVILNILDRMSNSSQSTRPYLKKSYYIFLLHTLLKDKVHVFAAKDKCMCLQDE